ncbi:MAG: hypothetical protein AB9835_10380 [Eubacteriales bacterium]
MKVNRDFVTNSSSTAFILSMQEEINQEIFLKALGIEGDSPMKELFSMLYEVVENEKQEIRSYILKWYPDFNGDISSFILEKGFNKETEEKVKLLLNEGKTVYCGKLSGDGSSAVESFFCCESFLICEDNIYFNGRISRW